jgi:hypothetical protein
MAGGDKRLFVPYGLLHLLQHWEQSQIDPVGRDHFFHTFNNLLLGFIVLGGLFGERTPTSLPDRYIADPSGKTLLKPWETLWLLTCLFHDPGYVGEKFWPTVNQNLAFKEGRDADSPIPDVVIAKLNDAWRQELPEARQDLLGLFRGTTGTWAPISTGEDTSLRFDEALQAAYFGDGKSLHSLLSGLYLIRDCKNNRVKMDDLYDPPIALRACEIAALSMMFHDYRCRRIFRSFGIPPVSFELLPYASTLAFVDAIQDDRRVIGSDPFRRHGILGSLVVGNKKVTATVCLRELLIEDWPSKIAEYEDVMRWINNVSETKFFIDYRTGARF